MLLTLLAGQASAVDAERAFAADAQKVGQWTAFRAYATDDAVMFDPQPVNAQRFLKSRKDPPKSVEWRPARSFVSCDGTMAANTGPWRNANGGIGYFSTIWVRQPDGGWKWTIDGGDAVKTPKFAWEAEPEVRRASCDNLPGMGMREGFPDRNGGIDSADDGTLRWFYDVAPDGSRKFEARLWNGRAFDVVIADRIAAPPPRPAPKP
ncbi:hypothetical protein [Sphingomonas lenta]|uniref:DUF4440 domain-containing protein n=1 Tax=Sphingomonas lenta TaxID=1141887 RepID=A0A2A2SDI1_9SPHN|nr:hypothetical protein [Sphingomonas lenta]PAX07242.1 hypothetical protein CKY28_14525 [Sphingomonas lenta]